MADVSWVHLSGRKPNTVDSRGPWWWSERRARPIISLSFWERIKDEDLVLNLISDSLAWTIRDSCSIRGCFHDLFLLMVDFL